MGQAPKEAECTVAAKLDFFIDTKVDIEALERMTEPEDEEVCLRYILKYSTGGGSNISQLFDTKEKKRPFRGKQKALVGASRREGSPARKLAK